MDLFLSREHICSFWPCLAFIFVSAGIVVTGLVLNQRGERNAATVALIVGPIVACTALSIWLILRPFVYQRAFQTHV